MKGNEAIAHAAIRYGVDGYFGYRLKVKWPPSIWYMEVQVRANV